MNQGILKAANNVFMQCAVAVYLTYIFVGCISLQNTDIHLSVVITEECVRKTINKTCYKKTDKIYIFHIIYIYFIIVIIYGWQNVFRYIKIWKR